MNPKILYIFFLLCPTQIFSQNISGKVISKTTKQAIPYATVTTSSRRGVYSDSLGKFSLSGVYADSDSLQFRILGYESMRISVRDARKMKVFEMTESATSLSEVVVNKRASKEFLIGCKARNRNSKQRLIGSEFAIFVFNDEQKDGFLRDIDIYLDSNQSIKAKFRLTIYPSLDSLKELVREEILIENHGKNEGWFKVNLNKFRLQVLNQGFYVGLTLLADENGIPNINIGLTEGFEGGVIHARKRDEFSGWSDWSRFKQKGEGKTVYYAMIRATVDFYD